MMPGHMMGMGMGPMGGGMGGPMAMKMALMSGPRCPVCGEPLIKPTKDEMIQVLEHKKARLQMAVDHLNKEIEKLKASPQ
jgi:Protein of unknown function DUF2620.